MTIDIKALLVAMKVLAGDAGMTISRNPRLKLIKLKNQPDQFSQGKQIRLRFT